MGYAHTPPEAEAIRLNLRPLKRAKDASKYTGWLFLSHLQVAQLQPDGFSLWRNVAMDE
jgi:hypothetical protein